MRAKWQARPALILLFARLCLARRLLGRAGGPRLPPARLSRARTRATATIGALELLRSLARNCAITSGTRWRARLASWRVSSAR